MQPRHNQSASSSRTASPSSPAKRSSDRISDSKIAEKPVESKPAAQAPLSERVAKEQLATPPAAIAPAKPSASERPASTPVPTQRSNDKSIEFKFHNPQAKSACVAGTFNSWDQKRTPMRKEGDGQWKAIVNLPPGRYEYRFVVDGQWLSDPSAKDSVHNSFGSTNSVVVV